MDRDRPLSMRCRNYLRVTNRPFLVTGESSLTTVSDGRCLNRANEKVCPNGELDQMRSRMTRWRRIARIEIESRDRHETSPEHARRGAVMPLERNAPRTSCLCIFFSDRRDIPVRLLVDESTLAMTVPRARRVRTLSREGTLLPTE